MLYCVGCLFSFCSHCEVGLCVSVHYAVVLTALFVVLFVCACTSLHMSAAFFCLRMCV